MICSQTSGLDLATEESGRVEFGNGRVHELIILSELYNHHHCDIILCHEEKQQIELKNAMLYFTES